MSWLTQDVPPHGTLGNGGCWGRHREAEETQTIKGWITQSLMPVPLVIAVINAGIIAEIIATGLSSGRPRGGQPSAGVELQQRRQRWNHEHTPGGLREWSGAGDRNPVPLEWTILTRAMAFLQGDWLVLARKCFLTFTITSAGIRVMGWAKEWDGARFTALTRARRTPVRPEPRPGDHSGPR